LDLQPVNGADLTAQLERPEALAEVLLPFIDGR
jgi:hypothetical protein